MSGSAKNTSRSGSDHHRGVSVGVGVATIFFLLTLARAASATPPEPPVRVLVGEKVEKVVKEDKTSLAIPLELRCKADWADVRLVVSIRPDVPGLPGIEAKPEVVERQAIRLEGRQARKEMKINIPLPRAGTHEVTFLISGDSSEEGYSDKAIRYLIVDDRGEFRFITGERKSKEEAQRRKEKLKESQRQDPRRADPRMLADGLVRLTDDRVRAIQPFKLRERRQVLAPPAGPGPELEGLYREPEVKQTTRDPITIKGRLTYLDWDGVWRPLVNVSINIFDDDTFGDEHLGTVVTDWSGNFSFSTNNDDGIFQDGRDIYFTAMLRNSRLSVRDASRSDYLWTSDTREDVDDGSVIDFGTLTGSTGAVAMRMWGHLNLAWNSIVTSSGQDPGNINAVSPGSGTFWSDSANELELLDSDQDGPDTVFHEYGHGLMHNASGGNPSPGGSHGFGDATQDSGLSYSEGWATGWMLMVRPDGTYNWHEGQPGRSIENFSSANRVGERQEGRVAGAFLDFFDAPDDDNGGTENRGRNGESDHNADRRIGLDILYRQVMWGSSYSDFLQYWIALAGDLSGPTNSAAGDIMQYNWMSLPFETSCVATKVVSRGQEDRERVLSGLRLFRDLGLKTVSPGRSLARIYYRNSPEMAARLAEDAEASAAALVVMRHFARLGEVMAHHSQGRQSTPKVLPEEVEKAARLVIERLGPKASPELASDLRGVSQILDKLRDYDLEELRLILRAAAKANAEPLDLLDPSRLNPGSAAAVRRGLPPTK